ncbi:hypothetical protein KKD19_04375 [Patescibacteria group bacterium]|nr:hypothetical protein [Patescibacteria group bacterium]MBU4512444.1 hypothetical protein [Patescibacteria group bacterium]MCG2692572.1 hypothetical protein [Candidatus Parcubacteria bacterium]
MLNKLISQIQRDKNYTFTTLAILCVVFLWFVIQVVYPSTSGVIGFGGRLVAFSAFLFYWFIGASWLAGIFKKIVKFSNVWSFVFGIFLMLYLISFVMAFWIVFYKITVVLMAMSLMILILGISFLYRRVTSHSSFDPELMTEGSLVTGDSFSPEESKQELVVTNNTSFGDSLILGHWVWPSLAVAAIIAIGLLFLARTGDYMITPWSDVSPLYLYFYAFISFIIFLLIFSRTRLRTLLIIIILHSFLLHSYLPIVYKTGFGGDKWRHIAAERSLQAGEVYSPSLFGEEKLTMRKIGPFSVPEVFIVGNKTSYANQWGLTIALSWILNIDVFWIDLLLVFALWSIFIPLFLIKIGSFFIKDKIFLGLLTFVPSLFYPLQVYGSITIPVAFGFLYFVFMLALWLLYLHKNEWDKRFFGFLLILTALMYFNYFIYFVLILEIGAIIFVFKKYILPRLLQGRSPSKKFIFYLLFLLGFCVVFIPVLDKLIGLSNFDVGGLIHFWKIPRQLEEFFLGKLLGLGEFVPFPTFISQGNFIFMQLSRYSLSSTTFLNFVYWQKYISIFLWLLIVYGMTRIGKVKAMRVATLWLIFIFILLTNHFLSMYYMDGVRLLTKRLDLVIAFFLLPMLALGIYRIVFRNSKIVSHNAKIIALGLLLVVSSSVAYASGPKLEVVTEDELEAAEYVFKEIKKLRNKKQETSELEIGDDPSDQLLINSDEVNNVNRVNNKWYYCVLANTWPLLGLEAVSNRRVVTGGFPVYTEYAQPERVQLWKKMISEPSIRYLEKSLEITGADHCYFMIEKKWFDVEEKKQEEKLERTIEMLGKYERFGEVYVFYYEGEDHE